MEIVRDQDGNWDVTQVAREAAEQTIGRLADELAKRDRTVEDSAHIAKIAAELAIPRLTSELAEQTSRVESLKTQAASEKSKYERGKVTAGALLKVIGGFLLLIWIPYLLFPYVTRVLFWIGVGLIFVALVKDLHSQNKLKKEMLNTAFALTRAEQEQAKIVRRLEEQRRIVES